MRQGYILVEGQTEFLFVRDVLNPYLIAQNLTLTPIIITTSRTPAGRRHAGGYATYASWRKQIRNLLNQSHIALVTTMLDATCPHFSSWLSQLEQVAQTP